MEQLNVPPGGPHGARSQDADLTKISKVNSLRQQVEQRMKAVQESYDYGELYKFFHTFKKLSMEMLVLAIIMKEGNYWNFSDDLGRFLQQFFCHFQGAIEVAMHLDEGFKEVPGYKSLCHLVDLGTSPYKRNTNPFVEAHIHKTFRDIGANPCDDRAIQLVIIEMGALLLGDTPTVPQYFSPGALQVLWESNDNLEDRISRLEAQLQDGFALFDRFMDHIYHGFFTSIGDYVRLIVGVVDIWKIVHQPYQNVLNARERLRAVATPDHKHIAESELLLANQALAEAKDTVLVMFRKNPNILESTSLRAVDADGDAMLSAMAALGLN